MIKGRSIKLNPEISGGFFTKAPIQGFTHNLYQYPARFSPEFARTVIKNFTEPGDLVLDPFMGSGTTLVEAMANNRKCIGTDISPLAVLISQTKTTHFEETDFREIIDWWKDIRQGLGLQAPPVLQDEFWTKGGYFRNLPWRIKKIISQILDSFDATLVEKRSNLARCVLLSATKTILDCQGQNFSVKSFLNLFESTLQSAIMQFRELNSVLSKETPPQIRALNLDANMLNIGHLCEMGSSRASIVITSPPYPGVHILYHRWQVNGSKETSAPFWIAGCPDGQGEAFYTLGGRSKKGIQRYFSQIKSIYSNLGPLLKDNALVFQMVAFSNIETQLPLFNQAMSDAGFKEMEVSIMPGIHQSEIIGKYLTRRVPLRKWYADLKGKTDSSVEFLLIHQKR